MQAKTKYALSGTAAGLVNGLFGGGGGMVLVPLLNGWCGLAGKQAFATCVAAILPLSAVSAAVYLLRQAFDWAAALPYLIGGLAGGRTAVPPGQRHMAAGTVRRLSAVRRREVYPVKSWLIPMAAGFGAGILSAWGVGGGTLLLLVMTLILGVPQQQAAAVNLLYFLPTAAMGVIAHKRNGLLETEVLKSAIPWGTTAAAAGALAATTLDTAVLRRLFGAYLLLAAAGSLRQLWRERRRK